MNAARFARTLVTLAIAALAFTSCGRNEPADQAATEEKIASDAAMGAPIRAERMAVEHEQGAATRALPPPTAQFDQGNAGGGLTPGSPPAYPDTTERQLIRNADVRVEVDDVDTSMARLGRLAGRLGGYVSTQEIGIEYENRRRGMVVLRIPAVRTDEALASIRRLGDVETERVWIDDVTEQYYDIRVRLENAQAEQVQLRGLLARAARVEDIIAIREQLRQVTTEIEIFTGQLRRMKNLIAYSTLTVTVIEPPPLAGDRSTIAGKIVGALRDMIALFWSTIAWAIRIVGVLVPAAILIAFVVFIVRLIRRWRRRRSGTAS